MAAEDLAPPPGHCEHLIPFAGHCPFCLINELRRRVAVLSHQLQDARLSLEEAEAEIFYLRASVRQLQRRRREDEEAEKRAA